MAGIVTHMSAVPPSEAHLPTEEECQATGHEVKNLLRDWCIDLDQRRSVVTLPEAGRWLSFIQGLIDDLGLAAETMTSKPE